jgi:phytoene dehydrogenase-like protein
MIEEKTDVLVIGSGIGGMCAAGYLAHKGHKVLVTEALPRIGGHCSTIEYKGIKVANGVIGPGLGGPLEALFREVGAEYNVRPAGMPHYLINGKLMELPAKGGTRALLQAATDNHDDVEKVLKAFSTGMRENPPDTMSMKAWLNQHTRDQSILNVFQTMAAATAIVSIDRISARGFFLFLKQHQGFRKWGVCPEGSIALPSSLAKVVENNRGEIWTNARAVRIHVDDGEARGATIIRNGKEVKVAASIVISNCGPKRTVDLVGRKNMTQDYLREIEKLTPASAISIHIKANAPLLEHDTMLVVGARRIVAIFQLTSVCPELAPPGTHYIVVGADPVSELGPEEAREEIDICMDDLKELIPEFETHGEILMTGCFHGDWPAMFSIAGQSVSPKTPVKRLYAVGDGFIAEPGMTAMVGAAGSGVVAAKDAVAELR